MMTMISPEEAQKEFHELEEKLKCLGKKLPVISTTTSHFPISVPIPAMIECANEEDGIIARMKELKRECPEIDEKVPALGSFRMMLSSEIMMIQGLKDIQKEDGIFLRIAHKLARWWNKIRRYGSD